MFLKNLGGFYFLWVVFLVAYQQYTFTLYYDHRSRKGNINVCIPCFKQPPPPPEDAGDQFDEDSTVDLDDDADDDDGSLPLVHSRDLRRDDVDAVARLLSCLLQLV